eukprot:366281-Chlamydomonas_euryale.AAC.22
MSSRNGISALSSAKAIDPPPPLSYPESTVQSTPYPLLDSPCLATLNPGMPFMGPLTVTVTLTGAPPGTFQTGIPNLDPLPAPNSDYPDALTLLPPPVLSSWRTSGAICEGSLAAWRLAALGVSMPGLACLRGRSCMEQGAGVLLQAVRTAARTSMPERSQLHGATRGSPSGSRALCCLDQHAQNARAAAAA